MTDTVIDRVRQSRDANRQEREGLRADMDAIITRSAANPGQTLNAQDSRRFSRLEARGREMASEARQLDDRLDELVDSQRRLDRTAAATAGTGDLAETRGPRSPMYTSSETYHKGNNSPSFFRDLIFAQRGDANAADRLRTNNAEVGLEARALGNTSSTGGSGGEFAPPGWLINDWVQLARPGRVTADLFHHEALPPGVSSVNLPRVGSGTAVTVQSTQNTTLANVDLTSAALSSGVVTIGGRQIVSQQLLDQSPVQFDRIVLEDLAQDYARALGVQVLTGSGTAGQLKGYLTPASTNVVTWTQATPTASGFYSQLAKLQGQINASRYRAPDAVIMHPRRWGWFASFTDSTGRPLVVPSAGGFNSLANPGPGAASGMVGSVLGMNCYTDANIPTNLGAGANQDVVIMLPRDDPWLWESTLRAEALTQPYGDSLGVLFRCFNYSALIPDRYPASLGQIQGTGLVTPTFAS